MKRLALAAAAALSLLLAPCAAATTNDNQFLAELHSRGLAADNGDNQVLVVLGHSVCSLMTRNGLSEQQVVDMMATNTHVTRGDLLFFVQAAERAYCPPQMV